MAYVDGRIIFSNLKGFPVLEDGSKINTQCFIDGAKEVVSLIESFGTLFMPVVYDMNGNIEKIHKIFVERALQTSYLEDLLLYELKYTVQSPLMDSLLWLKRALELLEVFFRKVANDTTLEESLKDHLREAYTETLKPYHGIIVQTAFSVVYRFISNRSVLIGNHKENVKHLILYLNPLRSHLNQINAFYSQYNLDHQSKVHSI
ncbi:Pleckstrin likey domain-containing family A member 8 [Pseudolycoriella hygida]|uniref:Pleckstrin likey domain-containing family A member 8 n=1 Tax=Pseudolycoriella hygida TaxID=35572 RepID=A0A9Q0MPQ2_9DIPT|nr:Pleckstrin likey domain-containing family A member 8 [Pseudolycoriella hygida]